MKIVMPNKIAVHKSLEKTLGGWEAIEKALTHKYIRRIPKKSGKGWYYIYQETFQKPILALKTFFGFKEEKITEDYEQHKIREKYGVDKKTFAAHVLEYLTNKIQWDTFFAQKEHRVKYDRPQKMGTVKQISDEMVGSDTQGELFDQKKKPADSNDKEMALNRSLMRKIWGIFNKEEEKTDGTNRTGTEQRKLPAGATAVRTGGSQEPGDQHVPSPKAGDNRGKPVQLPFEFGERPARDVRLSAGQTKTIRQACLELLKSKTDALMTEADKVLLRQYEGAGGLGEADAATHGTLYEFYTPRKVVNKVWQLVDKYLPGHKKVLEPSAGIGRFAENRPLDTFTLNELDDVSSRIAGILNPDAEIKQGAFQALFKPGKEYTGKKYDCVIGNPPYGAYAGLWKGKGEGKEHNRYEEYFIDRGLDTLRDGGIMAFVVPSGFLDGANDKIKAKIAEKGRVLEAWRLPNGVFNTTGVGTDIVVIRKEKGSAEDFSDGSYFKDNANHILGDVTERMNQFGKMQQYVALRQGDTFDSVIDDIPADAVEAVPLGEKTVKEQAQEKVAVKESEAEARQNRSAAMMGNQNARKFGFSVEQQGSGLYAVKVGEGRYMGNNGGGVMGGMFAGMAEFNIAEKAERAMNEYADRIAPDREKKEKQRKEYSDWMHQMVARGAIIKEETTAVGQRGRTKKIKMLVDPITNEHLGIVDKNGIDLYNEIKYPSSPEASRRSRSEAMQGNQNAAGSHAVDTAAEFNEKYNKHIAPEALPVWKATQWNGSIDLDALDKKSRDYIEKSGNYVKQADGRWYDMVNFASGNIYDKLEKLEAAKEALSTTEYERQKSILENALPTPKTVLEFDVSPLSAFAEKFVTSEMQGMNNTRAMPLIEMFKQWVQQTTKDELALNGDVSKTDLYDYVEKKRVVAARTSKDDMVAKEAARAEAARTVKARREAAERLFNQYIREQLSIDDQKRLAADYNRQYNGTVPADSTKIPVFLDGISRTFKGQEFRANESQMKGVSWTANQGNGIVAFDVGVGKTITAIMAAMNDIQMGRCQKPLICVPKAVYKNWIHEISQLFPHVKINTLGNFGDISGLKNADGSLNIEPGSLTLCTYEALQKVAFKDETLEGDLREVFSEALSALTDEDEAAARKGSKRAQKKEDKDDEDIMTKVGKASRTSGDNWVHWEDTGFDHITVDEAHNFRNSFSRPKNTNPGEADEFKDVPSGSTSLRGLKLFAVTQMIQKYNHGRNVHLLTATPFQNSPGEIYNMLSYVAREKLKEAGIENYHEFLTQFIELKSELSVDSKGNVTDKNVVKGFKNLGALQSLLNQYLMKIDGEDAGIIRPDKTDHIIELNPTAEQRDITEKIREYMESNPDPKKDPGAVLRCLNALRQAALSPALVDSFQFLDGGGEINVKNKDFVKSSPKMTFVCNTCAQVYKQHPDKGQIIHLPQRVSHYGEVKKYLVSQGIPADAIAFLAPEYLKSGDAGNDQKEEITRAFNDPENKIKIIIGSDTIKEGVNLNGNTIQTYECMLAWNPTDTQQLKGRSWRQGNKQGMVHITFPLMNDSVDSFMYQKHDEKGTRLDTLYNSKKDKLDVVGIDPEELKFALIKDPKKRADMQIKAETAELTQKQKIAESTSDKVFTMAGEYKNYEAENAEQKSAIENLKKTGLEFAAKSDGALKAEYEDLREGKRFGGQLHLYDNVVGMVSGKTIKEIREKYAQTIKDGIADAQKTAQRNKGRMETIAHTLARYGVTDPGNMTMVEKIRKNYREQGLSFKARIAAIEAGRDQRIKDAAAQIQAEAKPGVSVDEAVRQNTQAVVGNLYSMDEVKKRVLAERGIKKSLVVLMAKNIAVKVERRDA